MVNSDFVTKFYNLEGDTVGERKKNFFKLLRAQRIPLKEEDLNNLCPRTYLERLFEIDIFIYFKLTSKLLNVIKEGNPVFICRFLKHPQILKAVIGDVSAERFVNDFLPCTSYTIRMKILKQMSSFLKESQMDEIIFLVHKRYGLNIALKILHTGSSKKIEEYIVDYEVTLKPRQVKIIFNKDLELFVLYLKHYKSLTGKVFTHYDLSRYFAHKNPDFWLELRSKKLIESVTVGRRTAKHIIDHNNADFLNNVEHYSKFMQLDVISRKLQGRFKQVYINLFPKQIYKLNTHNFASQLLKYYPKNKQWSLFEEAFKEVFQKDIMDNLIHLNYNFLQMFPNNLIKNKWAEVHYDSDKTKSKQYLKYCDTKKVIPLIKEKISVTSKLPKRLSFLDLLIENCAENDDLDSLETVLEYIWNYHRTEDDIYSILDQVCYKFDLGQLNENHWIYMNKILSLQRLNKRLGYNSVKVIWGYIEFLYLQRKPYKNELMTFLRDVHYDFLSFDFKLKNPECKRKIFTDTIDIYIHENEFGDDFKIVPLLSYITDFNKEHPGISIDLSRFPKIVAVIKSLCDKESTSERSEIDIFDEIVLSNLKHPENPKIPIEKSQLFRIIKFNTHHYNFLNTIAELVTKHNRSEFENEVLQFFWDDFVMFFPIHAQVVRWFFFNEPKTIVPHIEKIYSLDKNCINLTRVKMMSHLDLDKILINYCTNMLDNHFQSLEASSVSSDTTKTLRPILNMKIIKVLCELMPTNEYIEIVERRFIPTKGDESFNLVYLVQCEIAKCFKDTQEPVKTLPTLMKFCLGDHLQSALPSLYSICYMTPETLLHSYIDVLSKRDVSVKKHALHLSCELLDFDFAVNMLENTYDDDISIQKSVFSTNLRYFRKNPCDTLLDMILINLEKINKNDVETLTDLAKVKLPKKYTNLYIQKCWYFIESLGEDVNVKVYLDPFLKSILSSEDIISSSVGLSKHIMTRYFKQLPKNEEGLQHIYQFILTVLRCQKSEETYDFIFGIFSEFKRDERIKPIKKLFKEFYNAALNDIKRTNRIDVDNNYHIELFKRYWFKTFTSFEMFNENVLLNLLYIKCKSYNQIETYAQDIAVYLEELVAQYGLLVYKFISPLMKNVYATEDRYLFIYNLLKFKNSSMNCILALDLLEGAKINEKQFDNDDDDEAKNCKIYNKILQILKSSKDPIVSLYLDSFINNS